MTPEQKFVEAMRDALAEVEPLMAGVPLYAHRNAIRAACEAFAEYRLVGPVGDIPKETLARILKAVFDE